MSLLNRINLHKMQKSPAPEGQDFLYCNPYRVFRTGAAYIMPGVSAADFIAFM